MIRRKEYEDLNLRVVKAWPPFDLEQLLAEGRKVIETDGPAALDKPTIFDLRLVDLMPLSSADIRNFIVRRQALHAGPASAGTVFLVRDIGSLGMMRMYSIYAELSGFRDEDLALVTMDMEEALSWIAAHARSGISEKLDDVRTDVAGWEQPAA